MLLSRLVASPKQVRTTPVVSRSAEPTRKPLAVLQSSTVYGGDDEDEGDQEESPPLSPSAGRLMPRSLPPTPSGQKRQLPEDFVAPEDTPSSKKVWFGPTLSPEVFSKDEPPATPVKRGAPARAGTPRREPTSTVSLLERLKTASPARSNIASPRSLGRTLNFGEYLQKPQPLKLGKISPSQSSTSVSASTSISTGRSGVKTILTVQGNPFASSSSPAPKPALDEA
ncbi:hypothetical protein DFQ26_001549 [Actinomortierella ambigua]|nr:hypothetical protein DFQ26_001549 [Actinomortierella ambigua]